MRTLVLGVVSLLLTAGCVHQGKLRSQVAAAQASGPQASRDDGHAIAEAHGVRLVAYGSSWKGTPTDIERHLTLVEVRLENHSGRPLSVRYELFELVGQERHAALELRDLRRAVSAQSLGWTNVPRPQVYARHLTPIPGLSAAKPQHPPALTYSPYKGTNPYQPPPCYTCTPAEYTARIPTPDMLRLAFREGPLEDTRSREGFLYFQGAMLAERQVTLQARLVDAHTGEQFGTLTLPFEVY